MSESEENNWSVTIIDTKFDTEKTCQLSHIVGSPPSLTEVCAIWIKLHDLRKCKGSPRSVGLGGTQARSTDTNLKSLTFSPHVLGTKSLLQSWRPVVVSFLYASNRSVALGEFRSGYQLNLGDDRCKVSRVCQSQNASPVQP